jgi:Fic family protein
MSPSPAPFRISPRGLALLLQVERQVGRIEGHALPAPAPKLRRRSRIRTVQGSVAIEGNTLTLDQVTALLEGKRVVGPAREVLEVQNALVAYEAAVGLAPWSERTLLRLHALLMKGLVPDAGRWRRANVGIFRGQRLRHMAPPASRVPALMRSLVSALRRDEDTPLVVRACIAHYEFQFIHPFSDGNGRVGRLWQHLILSLAHPVFALVPVESLIRERQRDYYRALARADARGDASVFVDFMLACLRDALRALGSEYGGGKFAPEDRLQRALTELGDRWFVRKDYLALFGGLSTATASRDLRRGLDEGRIEGRGSGARTEYRGRPAQATRSPRRR